MKKFIISEEEKSRILNLHEGFKKGLINEEVSDYTGSGYYTKVEGPFKDVGTAGTGDIYIMKLEKTLCRWDGGMKSQSFGDNTSLSTGQIFQMTGSTCGEGFTTIPSGKFYVQNVINGKIVMFNKGSVHYVSATNNGQGFNTLEEAKKGVSLVLNPQGKTGRQVEKGTDEQGTKYKRVTKYNQQGDVQKSKLNMTTAVGNKTVQKGKSGL
jgi:hypothetical protein